MSSIPSRSPQEEEELVRRIALRDERALAELYDRYAPLLYSLAARMVGEGETAEEVLQDVFLSVWRSAGSWDASRSSLRAWLVAITRHRAIDALRRRERPAVPLAADLPSGAVGPDEAALSAVLSQEVRAALAELPPEFRQVLDTVYFAGLTHREAAEWLGISQGTVKSRLRLALERLGRRLSARGYLR